MLLEWDEEEVYWSESIQEVWKMGKKHESPLMDQNHMEAGKSEKESVSVDTIKRCVKGKWNWSNGGT